METLIWYNDDEIMVLLDGDFSMERSGYYAGMGSVEDFKVLNGKIDITDELSERQIEKLKSQYTQYCLGRVS